MQLTDFYQRAVKAVEDILRWTGDMGSMPSL